jgi:hypothetical protein
MKTSLLIHSVAVAAFVAAMANGWASPMRQHSVSGVITDINRDAHTITLAPSNGNQPLFFVWKDSTRFSRGWSSICLGTLQPGQSAKVYYRREVGQVIPREVSLRTETPTRCATGCVCANGAN